MIVGLDLSLRASAAIALPLDFAATLDWTATRWTTCGSSLPRDASERERCDRLRTIRDHLLAFIGEHQPTAVFLEEQAFGQSGSMSREIAGMTWTVRLALDAAGVPVRLVTASAARKVLLGKVPRAKLKTAVQSALLGIGAPFADDDDVSDAFTIANFGLTELGHAGVMLGEVAA